MAPTVVKDGAFRLFFFSREETRMHVHVSHPDGEAKYWLEPSISLAQNFGLSAQHLLRLNFQVQQLTEGRVLRWERNTSI
jgi:hypothetical protein